MSLVRAVISQYLEIVPKSSSCGEDGVYDYYTTLEHDSLIIDNRFNRKTNKRKDVFYWNSETDSENEGKPLGGDAVTFLVKALSRLRKGLRNKSFREAKRIVKELGGSFSSPILITKEVETATGEVFVPHEGLVNSFWETGKTNREYWYKRGLTDKTIDKFKLGFTKGFSTIPIYLDNKFINFQYRKDVIEEDGSRGKKIFPKYKGGGIISFNFDNVIPYYKQIIISEAPTDILLAYQSGITNVISTLNGAGKWDQKWFSRFLHIEEFLIIMDNDLPGRDGAKKIANMLGVERCWIYTFEGFPDKYDWGDWMKEYPNIDFLEFIKDKKKRSYEL